MDKQNFGQLDMKQALNQIKQEIKSAADEAKKESQGFGDSISVGFDDGIDNFVNAIKASSIKTEKAFSKLSEKIRKQIQQLSANLNGKNLKFNIDFSDVDLNSDIFKNRVRNLVETLSEGGVVEFDTKGSEQQFQNLMSLYVKYQTKLFNLRQDFSGITVPEDAIKNLQKQYILATKLREISDFFDGRGFSTPNANNIAEQLKLIQNLSSKTDDNGKKLTGNYEELAKVLGEIQSSLKIISDVFSNESNAMQSMADKGTTSFKTLSEAIISVYDNLNSVRGLVDEISQKDFNVTNITQNVQKGPTARQQLKVYQEYARDLLQIVDELQMSAFSSPDLSKVLKGFDAKEVTDLFSKFEGFNAATLTGKIAGSDTLSKIKKVVGELEVYKDRVMQLVNAINDFGKNKIDTSRLDGLVDIDEKLSGAKAIDKAEAKKSKVIETQSQTQTVKVDTSSEVQQMQNLDGAINSVSKSIGRKNAGFIKEKEIVDETVGSEIERLNDLMRVLSNILPLLTHIKEKFTQSFVVPELDESKLQTSFDAIYNKFLELRDKIGTMQIDIGVNGTSITQAIQEALYAKEISTYYKKVSFPDQIFEDQNGRSHNASPTLFNWGRDAISKVTGEVFQDFETAMQHFNEVSKELYISKENGDFVTKSEMLSDITNKKYIDDNNNLNNFAQVIVQAINTQGGNIVQALKIVPSKNASDKVDESELINAFQTLSQAISEWNIKMQTKPYQWFSDVLDGQNRWGNLRTPEVDNALKTLGMMSPDGTPTFTLSDTGCRNLGVALSDNFVLPTRNESENQADELKPLLDEAVKLGASVPRIISAFSDGSRAFELQTRVPGTNIASHTSNGEFLNATDEQIDRLIHTFEVLQKVGLYPDFAGDNVLFDKQKGFSLVDLDTTNQWCGHATTPEEMMRALFKNIKYNVPSINSMDLKAFRDRVNARMALPPEQRLVNASTIAAEQSAAQNNAQVKDNKVKLTPTMDEGAVAKVVEENVTKTPATVKITPTIDEKSNEGYRYANNKDIEDAIAQYRNFSNSTDELAQHNLDEWVEAQDKFFDSNPIFKSIKEQDPNLFDNLSVSASFDSFDEEDISNMQDFISKHPVKIPIELPSDTAIKSKTESVISTAEESAKSTDDEARAAEEAAKQFVDAAKAKQKFVEANKNVKKSADESSDSVKKEAEEAEKAKETMTVAAENVPPPGEWDKTRTTAGGHGEEPFSMAREKTDNTDDAVQKVVERWSAIRDEDGELTGEMQLDTVTIINDYKKRTEAIQKESEKIATAQAYLKKFLTQFDNKTMGKGQLLSGYQELSALANSDNFKLEDIAKAEAMMSSLDAEYNKVVQSFRKGSSSMNPFVNAINSMEKMPDVFKNLELDFKSLREQPDDLRVKIEKLKQQFEALKGEKDIYKYAEGFGNLKVAINSVIEALRQARKEQKLETKTDFFTQNEKVNSFYTGGYLSKDIADRWNQELEAYRQYLTDANNVTDEKTAQWREKLTKLYNEIVKIGNASKNFFAKGGILSEDLWLNPGQTSSQDLTDLYGKVIQDSSFEGFKTQITGVNEQLGKLTFTADDGRGALTTYTLAVDKATGATQLLKGTTKSVQDSISSFGNALKKDFTGLLRALIGGSSVYKIAQMIKQSIQAVRELDSAMTELKKVTDETEETYDKFLKTASSMASRIGSTMKDVVNSTADFARLGYTLDEATQMAESAQVLMNVSEYDNISNATDALISAIKANFMP